MKHLGTVELETERLILRQIKKSDAKEIFEGIRNQPEFLYYTNKQKVSYSQHLESLKDIEEKYKKLDYYNWVIVRNLDNKIVGAINFRVVEINNSIEFNYAVDNRYTNNGYMTEALKTCINFAFEKMQVIRVQGGCITKNLASKKVMEKCNLSYEGTLKKYLILKDGYHDMHMFAITK